MLRDPGGISLLAFGAVAMGVAMVGVFLLLAIARWGWMTAGPRAYAQCRLRDQTSRGQSGGTRP
jgi:hypothetical protein